MSFDYPDYLRIRERSRLLGWLWIIGDRGYYLGLLGAVLAFSGAATTVLGISWDSVGSGDVRALQCNGLLPVCIVAFPICLGVFLASAYMKGVAHRRSGIHGGGSDA